MQNELLQLKNDIVFQELFGRQKNREITRHFISLILQREIKDIDLDVNKRMIGNRKDAKTGRLDIRAKFNDGEDCDIELQVAPFEHMEKRMLLYWAKMYQNKVSSGEKYEKLKPTISILIADYKVKELLTISKYHTIWNLREKENSKKILTEDIEMHILEIPKIKEDEILKDELALWLKFIENPKNEEVEKHMHENRFLKQAKEELAYLSGDPDFQDIVESRADFLMDQYNYNLQAEKRGLEKGMKEGEKKKQIEIAKKLIELNLPIEKISKATELSEQEILKLRNEKI